MIKTPTVKWAQRHDIVYVSMELPNITETKFDVDESNSRLTFSGKVDGEEYGLDMLLFGQVVKEKSVFSTVGREVILTVAKKGLDAPWWPRLIAETGKNAKIAIDWSRWRDSDEEADDSKVIPDHMVGPVGDDEPDFVEENKEPEMEKALQNLHKEPDLKDVPEEDWAEMD